jgi:hypothetical protein
MAPRPEFAGYFAGNLSWWATGAAGILDCMRPIWPESSIEEITAMRDTWT